MPGSHLSAIPIADVFSTGGFSVLPGQMFTALNVPANRLFVLTDVIVFPVDCVAKLSLRRLANRDSVGLRRASAGAAHDGSAGR
jgi:hypothetical protein